MTSPPSLASPEPGRRADEERQRRSAKRAEQRRRKAEGERCLKLFWIAEETIAELVQAGLVDLTATSSDEALADALIQVLTDAPGHIERIEGYEAITARLAEMIEELARRCEHRKPGRWCGEINCLCQRAVYVARGPIE